VAMSGGRQARRELCSDKESEERGLEEVGVVWECSPLKQLNQDDWWRRSMMMVDLGQGSLYMVVRRRRDRFGAEGSIWRER
jgi:hypothetical protein